MRTKQFDVIIIGGSYSGLAAGLALGRALKHVLIIDSGDPCNKQTPHSHNFLTQDGKTPSEIKMLGKQQVMRYNTVSFLSGLAAKAFSTGSVFKVELASGEAFLAKKLIFATGIKDLMPDIDGLATCWGISVLHCPYCHGYEVRGEKTGILNNGEGAYNVARLISNWTSNLTLFTNGPSTLTTDQEERLSKHHIQTVEKEIVRFDHTHGNLHHVVFRDGTKSPVKAMYSPSPFKQHCAITESLGCQLTDDGYIAIDAYQQTTIKGVFACGDNTSRTRTVANSIAMGTAAGITVSKGMILEEF